MLSRIRSIFKSVSATFAQVTSLVTRKMATNYPHRRYNPLKDEWIIVSPQRCNRPWSGQTEKGPDDTSSIPAIDKSNPLSPGGTRGPGKVNPDYERTYAFDNDFPALLPDAPDPRSEKTGKDHPLFQSAPARGQCRVMCFHRRSDLQLATMTSEDIIAVIEAWIQEYRNLAEKYTWVQVFENKGAIMGCSNPHPHCQIWASEFLPNEPATKDRTQREYYQKYKVPLLVEYCREELERKERVVCENDCFVALVPYWAVWPFETMLLPKRHVLRLSDLTEDEKRKLAEIMKRLLVKYDNVFQCSFPYSMGWHGAPTGEFLRDSTKYEHWQLHAVYLPPLLRSATVKKFMAGYEMVCEPQRDITAEMAAERLRQSPDVHYKSK